MSEKIEVPTSNLTIKVSKTWRSLKFFDDRMWFWNCQSNTNNFSFWCLRYTTLKSTIPDGQPDGDAGKQTIYSPLKARMGSELGNTLSHLCHEFRIRKFENFKTCWKLPRSPNYPKKVGVWGSAKFGTLSQILVRILGSTKYGRYITE